MKHLFTLLFFLQHFITSAYALNEKHFSNLHGFSQDKVSKEIFVEKIELQFSDFWAFRATALMDANIDHVLTTLRDVEGSKEWTPALIEKRTLKDVSDVAAVTYNDNDIMWPATDRDLVLHNELYLDKEHKLLVIEAKSTENLVPLKNDRVRAFMHEGLIALRPYDKSKTWIEIYIHVDPKGSLPAWLVNHYQKNWPKDFIQALEKRSQTNSKPMRPGIKKALVSLRKLLDKK